MWVKYNVVTKPQKVKGREKWGVKCNEMKWMEVKWCDVKWSAANWSEVMWSEVILGEMCVLSLIYIYVGSVQYAVSLLFASLCYFLITRLVSLNIIFMSVFLFCIFVFYFVYSVLLCCFAYWFSFCIQLSLYFFCTSLPATAIGWKPNGSK
jgi:hypothetical protein